MLVGKRILLGVTGRIAAYQAVDDRAELGSTAGYVLENREIIGRSVLDPACGSGSSTPMS